jgi:predicted  nucleic acid-binding Zn-ribbon protein
MFVENHTIKTNCKFCGKLFDSFKLNKVCPTCNENMENYFKQIKEYLSEHVDSTAVEICEALNIPVAVISYFLKEERLFVKNKGKQFLLRCEKCKKPISSGRYCFECSITETRSEMKEKTMAIPATEEVIAPRFHTNRVK